MRLPDAVLSSQVMPWRRSSASSCCLARMRARSRAASVSSSGTSTTVCAEAGLAIADRIILESFPSHFCCLSLDDLGRVVTAMTSQA